MTITAPLVQIRNEFERFLFEGVAELIDDELFSYLNSGTENIFQNVDQADLFVTLANCLGEKSFKGILYRAGEQSFLRFYNQFGTSYQLNDDKFRFNNSVNRIRFGLDQLAAFFYDQTGIPVEVGEDLQAWFWKISSIGAEHLHVLFLEPFISGWLRGFLCWVNNGRFYVMETEKDAVDENLRATILIYKLPLGN